MPPKGGKFVLEHVKGCLSKDDLGSSRLLLDCADFMCAFFKCLDNWLLNYLQSQMFGCEDKYFVSFTDKKRLYIGFEVSLYEGETYVSVSVRVKGREIAVMCFANDTDMAAALGKKAMELIGERKKFS